ncbi:uncharacterized protein LOC136075847 [Hydra vulgaris]|uniref:Uncharacterized protein LOC136075847 n=1 Tax=Hydra vulgaris TaxID=6087 RepID=A0ABM4B902_HYDVU
MKSCGVKKLSKLQQHISCFSHKAALHDYYHFMTTENHIDIILNISNRKEAIKLEQKKDFNKQIVVILFDIARTLSRQGLAFRGDGDESPRSQNEFIELLAKETRNIIIKEIHEANIYSVSADTTPDISHQDCLSVCVRYVNSQGKSVERLLEIEKGNDKIGSGTASQIVNILENNLLKPELIPFQSNDFASNMSGKFNGTHVKFSELVGHKIIFIPCQAQRWTARAESVKAVWNSLEAVVESPDKILLLNECFDKGTRSKALALRKQILSFNFIVSISFTKNIMYKLKYLTETLEAKNLSIIDAITLIDSTMKILTSINYDNYAMNNFINSAKEFATLRGIDSEADFRNHHRRKLAPKRFDCNSTIQTEFTMNLFYRKEFKIVLDTIFKLTNENLKTCISSIEPLYLLFSQPFNKLNISFPPASQGANLQDYDLVQTEL